MNEVLEGTLASLRAGRKVTLATLIAIEGSAPRQPGAMLAVDNLGRIFGSISAGCVEADIVERAERLLCVGGVDIVSYAASDPVSAEVGLTCGGRLEIALATLPDRRAGGLEWCEAATGAIAKSTPVVVAFAASRTSQACPFIVDLSEESPVDYALAVAARELSLQGGTRLVECKQHRRFLVAYGICPRMIVFGAMDFSNAVAKIAKFLGYTVTVVDARERFATRERIPDADDIIVAWPEEYVQREGIATDDAIIILSHEERFDIPVVAAALASNAAYIGVMGSRSTHARRLKTLQTLGFNRAQLARLHAPIGLDIGARTPQEIAISITSELLAVRASRKGGSLSVNT